MGWNPGNLPSYEIKSLLQNDPQDCIENRDSASMYVNGNFSKKKDIVLKTMKKAWRFCYDPNVKV